MLSEVYGRSIAELANRPLPLAASAGRNSPSAPAGFAQ